MFTVTPLPFRSAAKERSASVGWKFAPSVENIVPVLVGASVGATLSAKFVGDSFPVYVAGLAGGGLAGLLAAWLLSGDETYVDQKGVTWHVWDEGPWWAASTDGYGGRFSYVWGDQTRESMINNIEQNSAIRDPATGNVL